MSGTNGPVWLTTIRTQQVASQDCQIVTFEFVDVGATLSVNLTLKEVIVNWAQLASSGAGTSNQVYLANVAPDGSGPRWAPA